MYEAATDHLLSHMQPLETSSFFNMMMLYLYKFWTVLYADTPRIYNHLFRLLPSKTIRQVTLYIEKMGVAQERR